MEPADVHEVKFKIVLVGDSRTGKTSIRARYCDKPVNESYSATTVENFDTKQVEAHGGLIQLKIVDTPGQEKYKSLSGAFAVDTDLAIVVYDIANKRSFDHLEEHMDEMRIYTNGKCKFAIFGNKCDLSERVISYSDGEKFAAANKCPFFEVSAKDNINLNQALDSITHIMLQARVSETSCMPSDRAISDDAIRIPIRTKRELVSVVITGPERSGKSSLLRRFAYNDYSDAYNPTQEWHAHVKQTSTEYGKFALAMIDLSTKELNPNLGGFSADVIVYVFDLTRQQTLEECEKVFISEVRTKSGDHSGVLLGTNLDSSARDVPYGYAESIAAKYGLKYFECSNKTGENMATLIDFLRASAAKLAMV